MKGAQTGEGGGGPGKGENQGAQYCLWAPLQV